MEFDALTAGVAPGGLNNLQQIRLLVCYILRSVKSPVGIDILPEMLQYEELANFFEVSQAIDQLIENENIVLNDGQISLTEKGRSAIDELDFILPLSIREKAVRSAVSLLTKIRIAKENIVEVTKAETGYNVSCVVLDRDTELMRLTLRVPDKSQAEAVKAAFMEDPQRAYAGAISLLMERKSDQQ